jgi:hypothetical protein
VFAVLALVNECRWNPQERELRTDVNYEIGRRMTTSSLNPISPDTVVTPDCVVQLGATYGLVAEAKAGLSKDDETWDQHMKQLQKYDDDLTGWWTSNGALDLHDIVALVPLARAVRFADRLERGTNEGQWKFKRKLAVVGFFKTSGVKDFLTSKKSVVRCQYLTSMDDCANQSP